MENNLYSDLRKSAFRKAGVAQENLYEIECEQGMPLRLSHCHENIILRFPSFLMNTILCAGYPKSGNTLLGQSLVFAGGLESSFDIYQLKREKLTPEVNPLFSSDACSIKTHDCWRPSRDIHHLYFGKVSKAIVIVRNPFDTLLSGINHFRVVYQQNQNKIGLPHKRAI